MCPSNVAHRLEGVLAEGALGRLRDVRVQGGRAGMMVIGGLGSVAALRASGAVLMILSLAAVKKVQSSADGAEVCRLYA